VLPGQDDDPARRGISDLWGNPGTRGAAWRISIRPPRALFSAHGRIDPGLQRLELAAGDDAAGFGDVAVGEDLDADDGERSSGGRGSPVEVKPPTVSGAVSQVHGA
jgi:hypothetical protein